MEEGGRGGKAISWHNEACFAAATRNSFPEEEEGEEEEEEDKKVSSQLSRMNIRDRDAIAKGTPRRFDPTRQTSTPTGDRFQ